MSDEYKRLKIADFEAFKWYRTKWGEPGRYIATVGFEWKSYPILLSVNQYVAETTEGKYKMKASLSHSLSTWLEVKDMLPGEKKDIEKALKNSKREVTSDILRYIFLQ